MATVTKIPATKKKFSRTPAGTPRRKQVAGYARVSTDHEEQLTSYEAQLAYYTKYIKGHPDWEFAGMYADEGISGTGIKKRIGFQNMIDDALAGKIDLIVTKSVSRFARNTVDSLTTIRKLKEKGIEVFFEKENIHTLESSGELLITLMSSLSQEESRSISENTTWGQRRRFADGKASVAFSHFLGYDRGPHGEWVVNEEQAEIVKEIYRLFLEGYSYAAIAKKLTEEGKPSPSGNKKWPVGTVKSVLQNEKYMGCALLQKTFTVDFLTKKTKENEGEVPQYFVRDHHTAIIDPQTFDLVQIEIERRTNTGRTYSGVSIFSSKIVCGECGAFYGSKVWHSNDKYRKVVWRCNHKYKEHGHAGNKCSTPTLAEDEIKAAFVRAMNTYLGDRDEIIRNIETARKILSDTSDLEKEKQAQADEMNVAAELIHQAMEENARTAQDQDEYNRKYIVLEERYKKAVAAYSEAESEIRRMGARNRLLGQMIKKIKELNGPLTEFDAGLWGVFVDRMTIMTDGRKIVRFKDGPEVCT